MLPSERMLAYWFAFTPNGTQTWFGADATIEGDFAFINAYGAAGGRWIPNFDSAEYTPQRWGGLTFAFTDCNHGRVRFVNESDYMAWAADRWRSRA